MLVDLGQKGHPELWSAGLEEMPMLHHSLRLPVWCADPVCFLRKPGSFGRRVKVSGDLVWTWWVLKEGKGRRKEGNGKERNGEREGGRIGKEGGREGEREKGRNGGTEPPLLAFVISTLLVSFPIHTHSLYFLVKMTVWNHVRPQDLKTTSFVAVAGGTDTGEILSWPCHQPQQAEVPSASPMSSVITGLCSELRTVRNTPHFPLSLLSVSHEYEAYTVYEFLQSRTS